MPRRRLDGSGWLRGLRVWRKLTELFYKISSSLIYMYIQKVHTKEYTKTLSNFIYELIKNGNIWNEKKLHISKCGTSIISQWISVTANFKFADPYESQICTYMYEHISDYQCIRSESKNVNIMLIIIISNKFTAIKIIFFFKRDHRINKQLAQKIWFSKDIQACWRSQTDQMRSKGEGLFSSRKTFLAHYWQIFFLMLRILFTRFNS